MIYNRSFQLNTIGVPDFSDAESLAYEVKLSVKLIYYLSNDKHEGRYRDFEIPKKSGGTRRISAPCYSLKVLQRWVLETVLYRIKVSPYSYGFVRNGIKNSTETYQKVCTPIAYVASKHAKNQYILKMDLKNFFPSINRGRIFYQFIKIGYGSYASSLLTEICTHNGVLPQGAVTSPYLANIICYAMDMRIAGYCNKRGITYTRYADDMVFSSDDRSALRNIYGMISGIVRDEGFQINEKKTHFLSPKVRKEVLGLILNDERKPLVPRNMKRKIRAMIHHQIVAGDYSEYSKVLGYIAYVESVEPGYIKRVKKYIRKFQNDRIMIFPDAVKAFNEHKYFKDLPEMKELSAKDFFQKNGWISGTITQEDISAAINDIFYDREEFIGR